jgi:acetyl-CoA carboxylase biotin carboxylase subunit
VVAESVGYLNAGTVEFLVDCDTEDFYFLEVNTRLQVEHPVSEETHRVDLVELQLRIASGETGLQPIPPGADVPRGHAIELRVCAEDPLRFLPGPGKITEWVEPSGPGVRVDSGYTTGTTVSGSFDALMAKLICTGATRDEAISRARDALRGFRVTGPKCNLPFLAEILDNDEFRSGEYDTGIVGRIAAARTR